MSADLIATLLTYVTAIVTGATFFVQGIAVVTQITPSTRDDEIVTTAQAWIKRFQNVLGLIALDTGSTQKKSA